MEFTEHKIYLFSHMLRLRIINKLKQHYHWREMG